MEDRGVEDGILRGTIAQAARSQMNAIEVACEAMLVDPRGWGVLVHTGEIEQTGEFGFRIGQTVALSPLVPFGEIHDHKTIKGQSCAACERAEHPTVPGETS